MAVENHHCSHNITFSSPSNTKSTQNHPNNMKTTNTFDNYNPKLSHHKLTVSPLRTLPTDVPACSYKFDLTVRSSSFISHSHQASYADSLHHPQWECQSHQASYTDSPHHRQWECLTAVPNKGAAGGRQTNTFNEEYWTLCRLSSTSRQTLDEFAVTPTPSSDTFSKMRPTKENIL